ncbi:MAG: hypothetical protein IT473_12050 [Lysobacter sp.]|nr:hypothetical protein [Lysobacter sp.]
MNAQDDDAADAPKSPKKKKPGWLVIVAFAVGGGFIGWLGAKFGAQKETIRALFGPLDALSAFDLLALPLSLFLVVLWHELGHLAGGMLRGMRFLLLIVGPLRLRRTVSGLKLDWFLRGDTFGGLAAAMPAKDRIGAREFLPLVIGGPLASLLLAVAGFATAHALDGRWAAHAGILGALSFMIFLATAIPMRAGGFLSDGMQFLELLRGGPAVEQRTLLVAAYAESLAGTRPRDRDASLLERGLALAGHEPMRDVALQWMAYQAALDRRELDRAGHWIDRVADGYAAYPAGFREALACDVAYFAARYRADLPTALEWSERAKGGMVETVARAMTEAAIALARDDAAAATAAVERGDAALREVADAGTIPLLQDELRALRAEAQARAAAMAGL